ncbi:GNAT family N-acetyltransferase [Thalassotalea sp. PLHSN55]|uniref:GNAT family N-acetyltransferase n=1 Tax=Thalassotalea sp. PLHSN55 TaxID=3435888 RepID=UPI003F84F53B
MNLSIDFLKPQIKSAFDWQLSQEINVLNEQNEIIAKAEIEIITLNKHRDATASLALLSDGDYCDWTIPLTLCFHKQNLTADLCELLEVKADTKAKSHILLEAISVMPQYRKQGIAKLLLTEIANKYPKVQSINLLSMPMHLFVEPEHCETPENQAYYQALGLSENSISADALIDCFNSLSFKSLAIDESELDEPLPYTIFIGSPNTVLATAK